MGSSTGHLSGAHLPPDPIWAPGATPPRGEKRGRTRPPSFKTGP